MRHKTTMATLVGGMLLAWVGMSLSRAAAPAGTAAGAGQTKWEYKTAHTVKLSTNDADNLGAEGWELVAVVADAQDPGAADYYFKRPK